ncbi:hypothetical protein DSY14_05460 [Nocardiopsis sp. MG754419]|nr:hypothetical protein [Nocardiopsis sp. MG754419]
MLSDVFEWFKGLFGDTAGDLVDGMSGAADQAGAAVEGLGEGAVGEFAQDSGLDTLAQEAQEGALGEVTETAQGFQDQAETLGGVVEDPMGTAADGIRGQITDES